MVHNDVGVDVCAADDVSRDVLDSHVLLTSSILRDNASVGVVMQLLLVNVTARLRAVSSRTWSACSVITAFASISRVDDLERLFGWLLEGEVGADLLRLVLSGLLLIGLRQTLDQLIILLYLLLVIRHGLELQVDRASSI